MAETDPFRQGAWSTERRIGYVSEQIGPSARRSGQSKDLLLRLWSRKPRPKSFASIFVLSRPRRSLRFAAPSHPTG
jgi:hypothetical protein